MLCLRSLCLTLCLFDSLSLSYLFLMHAFSLELPRPDARQVLKEAGADFDAKDDLGWGVTQWAAANGHVNTLDFFLSLDIDVVVSIVICPKFVMSTVRPYFHVTVLLTHTSLPLVAGALCTSPLLRGR